MADCSPIYRGPGTRPPRRAWSRCLHDDVYFESRLAASPRRPSWAIRPVEGVAPPKLRYTRRPVSLHRRLTIRDWRTAQPRVHGAVGAPGGSGTSGRAERISVADGSTDAYLAWPERPTASCRVRITSVGSSLPSHPPTGTPYDDPRDGPRAHRAPPADSASPSSTRVLSSVFGEPPEGVQRRFTPHRRGVGRARQGPGHAAPPSTRSGPSQTTSPARSSNQRGQPFHFHLSEHTKGTTTALPLTAHSHPLLADHACWVPLTSAVHAPISPTTTRHIGPPLPPPASAPPPSATARRHRLSAPARRVHPRTLGCDSPRDRPFEICDVRARRRLATARRHCGRRLLQRHLDATPASVLHADARRRARADLVLDTTPRTAGPARDHPAVVAATPPTRPGLTTARSPSAAATNYSAATSTRDRQGGMPTSSQHRELVTNDPTADTSGPRQQQSFCSTGPRRLYRPATAPHGDIHATPASARSSPVS